MAERILPPVPHSSELTDSKGVLNKIWATWFDRISDFTTVKSGTGYLKIGKLIFQWGVTANLNSGTTNAIVFPLQFPTQCLQVFSNVRDNSASSTAGTGHHGTGNYSVTGFDLYNRTSLAFVFNWFAIGC